MQTEINNIITLAEASNITGYTQDYLGFLCRTGKLEGQKIGRNWTTTRKALDEMKSDSTLIPNTSSGLNHASPGATKIPVKIVQPNGFLVQEQNSFVTQVSSPVIPEATQRATRLAGEAGLESMDPDFHQDDTQIQNDIKSEESSPTTFEKTFVVGLPISLSALSQELKQAPNISPALVRATSLNISKRNSPAYFSVATFAITLSLLASIFWIKPDLFESFLNNSNDGLTVTNKPVKITNQIPENKINDGKVLAAQSVTQARVTPAVLTQFELEKLIMESLAQAESLGFFRGPQGLAGTNGTSGTNPSGPIYIQPYIPSVPTSSNPGGTLAGFTDLSSQRFITDDATISDQLTVVGSATVGGDLDVTGTITAGGFTGTVDPGLTEGSIIFQGPAGLAQDNANFFWDDSTNRLGIGTATPGSTLDVVGTFSAGGGNTIRTSVSNGSVALGSGNTLGEIIGASPLYPPIAIGHNNTISTYNKAIAIGTSNTVSAAGAIAIGEGLTISGDNSIGIGLDGNAYTISTSNVFAVLGGNVGIGDTTPDYKLELHDTTTTPAFVLSDDDIAHGVTTVAETDSFMHLSSISTTVGGAYLQGIADATGVALQLRGIQSSDPTDTTPAISLIAAKASGTGVVDLAAAETVFQVTNNDDTAALTILGSGNVGIGTVLANAKLTVAGSMLFIGSQSISPQSTASGAGSDLTIAAGIGGIPEATGGDLYLMGGVESLGTNGNVILAHDGSSAIGNVGIGTTTPDGKLEIAGNVSSAAWGLNGIQLQGTAATYTDSDALGTRTNGVATSFGIPTFNSTNAVTITNAANVYIAGPPADGGANMTLTNAYALWVDAGTARFDGNILLDGTNTIQYNLHGYITTTAGYTLTMGDTSNGQIVLAGGNFSFQSDAGAGMAARLNTTVFGETTISSVSTSYNPLVVKAGSTTYLTILGSNGNIGIGDATPGAALVVGSDATMGVANGAGDLYVQNDLEVDGTLTVAGATTYSGALSVITTTSPQLTVGYDSSNKFTTAVASDGGTTWAMLGSDADLNINFAGATDGDFSINTDDLFVDTSTGYVGIGTVSPGQKLEVAGKIYSKGIDLRQGFVDVGDDTITMQNGSLYSYGGGVQFNYSSLFLNNGVLIAPTGAGNSATIGYSNQTLNLLTQTAIPGEGRLITSPVSILSSGSAALVSITPGISQTGTAGYTALLVNPTETTLGSGTNNLLDLQVGGSSKLRVDNTGNIYSAGTIFDTPSGTFSLGDNDNSAGQIVFGTGANKIELRPTSLSSAVLAIDVSSANVAGGSGGNTGTLRVNRVDSTTQYAIADFSLDSTVKALIFYDGSLALNSSANTPSANLLFGGARSQTAWGLNGIQLQAAAATYTDSGALGTRTNGVANSFGIPTFDSTNAVTITNAANVYIAGPPADGGANMTLTNAYALWVDSGNSRFDGSLQLEGGTFPATGQGMELVSSNGTGYIQMYNRDTSSWDDLQMNVEDLTVTTSGGYTTFNGGYVGIGGADVSPDATLEIINSGNDDSFLVADDADGDTTPFVIQSNGDVGIGNANPAQKLHVGDGNNPAFASEGLIRVGASNGAGSYREWDLGINTSVSPYNFIIKQSGSSTPSFFVDYAYDRTGIGPGASVASAKLSVLNAETAIGGSMSTIQSANTGATFDTTGAAFTSYGASVISSSTRSAGANDLTNVGLYASASGAQNNYAAIFDSGYVGIGIAVPLAKLHVFSGDSAVATFEGNNYETQLKIINARSYVLTSTGAASGYGLASGSFGIIDATDSVARMVFTSTGNTGIGTATPDGKLEIAGNMTQAAWGLNGIQLQGTAATYTNSSTAAAGTETNAVISSLGQSTLASTNAITTTNAYGLYLAGAPISGANQTLTNTSALYIGAAATVDGSGVAPTNSYGLYVNAQTGATNNYAAQFDGGHVNIRSGNSLVLYRTDNTIAGSIYMNNSNEIQFSGGVFTNGGSVNLGGGSIFGSNPIITSQTGNSVTLQATPNGSPTFKNVVVDTVGVSSTGYLFAIRNNGTEKISVDYNGNLGLGTTSPTALLDVNNTTTTAITAAANARVLNLQGAFTEAGSGVHSRIVGMEITPPTITAGAATVTNTASLYISDAPTATVTGGNYSLWVDAGNSRFDGALQLNGGSFPATGEGMELIASNDIGYIQVYNRDTSSWGDLQINVEDLTVTANGGFTTFAGANVGIGGDLSPDALLEVINDASGDSFLVADGSDGDTTPFVIQADGDVGVGTASPVGKFSVQSGISAASMTLGSTTGISQSLNLDGNGWGMYFGVDTATGNGWIQQGRTSSATAYNLSLQASGGNVGIGTSDPTSIESTYNRLIVQGSDASAIGQTIINTGTGQVALSLNRTGGTASRWLTYLPSGSTDLRVWNASDLVTFQASGDVGIGDGNPTEKLSVAAGTMASGVGALKVTGTFPITSGVTAYGANFDFTAQRDSVSTTNYAMNVNLASSQIATEGPSNEFGGIRVTTGGVGGGILNNYGIKITQHTGASGATTYGLYAQGGFGDSTSYGVYGTTSGGPTAVGVYGESSNVLGIRTSYGGMFRIVDDVTGDAYGVYTSPANAPTIDGTYYGMYSTINGATVTGAKAAGLFTDGTTTSTFNNGTYAALFAGGNVGIGTATPGAKLQVNGDASGIGQIIKANATTPGNLLEWQNSSGTPYLWVDSSFGLNFLQAAGATGTIIATPGGGNYLDFNSFGGIWFNGDAGVKTANSLYAGSYIRDYTALMKLDLTQNQLYQNWNVSGTFGVNDLSADASLEVVNDASGDSFLVADSADGDTSPFVIQADGDVGIGTASPGAKLDITGSNATEFIALQLTNIAGGGNELTTLLFKDNCCTGTAAIKHKLYVGGTSAELQFHTTNAGSSAQRMVIDNAGNVGIGAGSPTAFLDVNNATASAITAGANARVLNLQGAFTEAGSGTHTRIMGMEITAPVITGGLATVTDTATLYISDAPTATVSGANYALWVDAGAVRFDNTLEVRGSNGTELVALQLVNTAGGANELTTLLFKDSGYSGTAAIKHKLYAGGTSAELQFYTTNAGSTDQRMVIDNAGNVGIGVAAPGARLQVNAADGSDGTDIARFLGGSNNSYLIIESAASIDGSYVGTPSINSNGDIGILQTIRMPSAKSIEIYQTTYSNGQIATGGGTAQSGFSIRLGSDGTYQGPLILRDGSNAQVARFEATGNVGFGADTTPDASLEIINDNSGDSFLVADNADGDSTPFVIQADGDVGIGVTAPAYKLDVETNTSSTYSAYFFNDGNDADRYGIQIQGGADDASGTTYYLRALDGDGGEVGYIANTSGTFALTDSSDVRTKTKITNTIEAGLATIMQLRVVDFNRLADPDGPRITGFIAQEVNEVYPKIVNESSNGFLGISKENLIPILVKAMQEQQAELQSVKSLAQSLQGLGQGILQVDSLVVNSHVAFNEDTVGQAKILGTDNKVRISFSKQYEYQPVVTVTPMEFATVPYRVTEVDVTGFTIEFASVIGYDVTFNWHSFGSKEGKLTISDGTKQDIAIIVPQAPNPNVAQIQENNLVVDGSGTSSTGDQVPTENTVIDGTSAPQILEVPTGNSGAGGGNGGGNPNTGLPTIEEIISDAPADPQPGA